MAQQRQTRGRIGRAHHGIRRAWPFVLMAWERWQSLSPADKERYKRQARDYADRGKQLLQTRRDDGGGKPRG
jgi:hypothetical protein